LQVVDTPSTPSARTKSPASSWRTAIHDFEGDQTLQRETGHNFMLNATFAEVTPENLTTRSSFLRPRSEYLRLNPRCSNHPPFAEARKPIAAICHAAQLLAAARRGSKGRRCSCYPSLSPDVAAAAELMSISPWTRPASTATW